MGGAIGDGVGGGEGAARAEAGSGKGKGEYSAAQGLFDRLDSEVSRDGDLKGWTSENSSKVEDRAHAKLPNSQLRTSQARPSGVRKGMVQGLGGEASEGSHPTIRYCCSVVCGMFGLKQTLAKEAANCGRCCEPTFRTAPDMRWVRQVEQEGQGEPTVQTGAWRLKTPIPAPPIGSSYSVGTSTSVLPPQPPRQPQQERQAPQEPIAWQNSLVSPPYRLAQNNRGWCGSRSKRITVQGGEVEGAPKRSPPSSLPSSLLQSTITSPVAYNTELNLMKTSSKTLRSSLSDFLIGSNGLEPPSLTSALPANEASSARGGEEGVQHNSHGQVEGGGETRAGMRIDALASSDLNRGFGCERLAGEQQQWKGVGKVGTGSGQQQRGVLLKEPRWAADGNSLRRRNALFRYSYHTSHTHQELLLSHQDVLSAREGVAPSAAISPPPPSARLLLASISSQLPPPRAIPVEPLPPHFNFSLPLSTNYPLSPAFTPSNMSPENSYFTRHGSVSAHRSLSHDNSDSHDTMSPPRHLEQDHHYRHLEQDHHYGHSLGQNGQSHADVWRVEDSEDFALSSAPVYTLYMPPSTSLPPSASDDSLREVLKREADTLCERRDLDRGQTGRMSAPPMVGASPGLHGLREALSHVESKVMSLSHVESKVMSLHNFHGDLAPRRHTASSLGLIRPATSTAAGTSAASRRLGAVIAFEKRRAVLHEAYPPKREGDPPLSVHVPAARKKKANVPLGDPTLQGLSEGMKDFKTQSQRKNFKEPPRPKSSLWLPPSGRNLSSKLVDKRPRSQMAGSSAGGQVGGKLQGEDTRSRAGTEEEGQIRHDAGLGEVEGGDGLEGISAVESWRQESGALGSSGIISWEENGGNSSLSVLSADYGGFLVHEDGEDNSGEMGISQTARLLVGHDIRVEAKQAKCSSLHDKSAVVADREEECGKGSIEGETPADSFADDQEQDSGVFMDSVRSGGRGDSFWTGGIMLSSSFNLASEASGFDFIIDDSSSLGREGGGRESGLSGLSVREGVDRTGSGSRMSGLADLSEVDPGGESPVSHLVDGQGDHEGQGNHDGPSANLSTSQRSDTHTGLKASSTGAVGVLSFRFLGPGGSHPQHLVGELANQAPFGRETVFASAALRVNREREIENVPLGKYEENLKTTISTSAAMVEHLRRQEFKQAATHKVPVFLKKSAEQIKLDFAQLVMKQRTAFCWQMWRDQWVETRVTKVVARRIHVGKFISTQHSTVVGEHLGGGFCVKMPLTSLRKFASRNPNAAKSHYVAISLSDDLSRKKKL